MAASSASQLRVRVFVDFWNFSLSLRQVDPHFKVDWGVIGQNLAKEAARLVDPSQQLVYEGTHVYGSYYPSKPKDSKLKNWFVNSLDKMAGISVVLQERQKRRGYPKCPSCQTEVKLCVCGADLRGTEEKGVDTRIATDMIRFAWADGYNCAVLVSSDRDFVPVTEFLQTRGIKVVHGAFPPLGSALTQKCWAHINIPKKMSAFKRP